jgi:hypothetical protein
VFRNDSERGNVSGPDRINLVDVREFEPLTPCLQIEGGPFSRYLESMIYVPVIRTELRSFGLERNVLRTFSAPPRRFLPAGVTDRVFARMARAC